jgi:hypothetical protein
VTSCSGVLAHVRPSYNLRRTNTKGSTTNTSSESTGPVTVGIEVDGRAHITAEPALATATELRDLAMLMMADELDSRSKVS